MTRRNDSVPQSELGRLVSESQWMSRCMKIKDITEWSERWSTPLGTLDANAPVADGVIVRSVSMGNIHP